MDRIENIQWNIKQEEKLCDVKTASRIIKENNLGHFTIKQILQGNF